jgi:hypothetical protein
VALGFRGTGGKLFDMLAPGLYAWGLTVAWPVAQRFAPLGSRIFALVALVSLVSGASLMFSSPSLARVFGIWVFLASCIGAWGWFAPTLAPLQLDPLLGALGSLGWALFAVSWASGAATPTPTPTASPTPKPTSVPTVDPIRPARPSLPKAAAPVLALVTVAAAVPMVLSWYVASLERALLAHAVSLAAALALVAFAVDLFEPRTRTDEAGFDASRKPERRIASALPAFLALTTLAVLGAAYTLLR